MDISLKSVPITVNDVDEALAFYVDALGLEKQADVAAGDFRWVTLGFASEPGLGIVLSAPHAGRSAIEGALQVLVIKGTFGPYGFTTNDVDAVFEKIRASGAEVIPEPMEQAWGPRDCAFRDSSGNMVRIAQSA